MALELGGSDRKRLRLALMAAFPGWDRLRIMASDYLDVNLAVITSSNDNLETQAFELIEWAKADGALGDLVMAARYANPGNPELLAFAQRIGISSTDTPKSALEALVSTNQTFLDVAVWREQLTRLEWRVCRVDIDGVGRGTGFLVGPDLVLTNHHVVRSLIDGGVAADQVSCLFDFKAIDDEIISKGLRVEVAGNEPVVASSPPSPHDLEVDPKTGEPGADELDFALLRLAQAAGEQSPGGVDAEATREWIEVRTEAVDFAQLDAVAVLQHPERRPLKLSIGTDQDLVVNEAGNRVRYTVPTLPGSSGSPVFDSDWNLVALHHSGDPDTGDPDYNQGIPISVIADSPGGQALLAELADLE